ncbi:carbamoyltransferase C-terminal domain-containing protein [Pseudomonas sp. ZL2]
MKIVSFNTGHDGHICFVNNDELVFSYEAEKDNNPRYSYNTPTNLARGFSASSSSVDVIAVSGWARENDPRSAPTDGGYLGLNYKLEQRDNIPWLYCSHELSHIICSYALSPYADSTDCYVLLLEGFIGKLYLIRKDLSIELLEDIIQSPGLRYSFAFGVADPNFDLPKGYCRLGDAGKMMALAAFGRNAEITDDERLLLSYILDTPSPIDSFSKSDLKASKYYNIGVQSQDFCDLARKISNSLFELISRRLRKHIQKKRPLLIAGGCGLNCDWNKKWKSSELFTDIFVPPCTNDTGVAIGAAALANKTFSARSKLNWSVYSGQEFSNTRTIDSPSKYEASKLSLSLVSQKLARGEIICWVQGKCEIGPRALGNRSIFAAPFLKTTTTKLNQIKSREHYRPIAPICLEEDAALHFEECTSSKFMLTFYTVIDPRLKAITHVDGTARVQTITYRDSPATYELLKNFKEATDVGVLCNTSLNFSGSGFINNRTDLERFCIKHNIMTFVINDTMYIKPGDL